MPCTIRCRRSRAPKEICRCSCGGANHGTETEQEGPGASGFSGSSRTELGNSAPANRATAAPRPSAGPEDQAGGAHTIDATTAAAATPSPVRRLAATFEAAGKNFHLVGGYVRDLMRGEDPKDVDATTNARPTEIKRLLLAGGASSLWEVGERFGTVGATFEGGLDVEVTTYRSEEYDPGNRKPRVTFGDSLEDDLARRDFTINAMALDPRSGQLVDPHSGAEDLDRGVVRAVGNPDDRLSEDPLRMMRAVRFSAKLGFSLDNKLKVSVSVNAGRLDEVSRERVREELEKTLSSPSLPSRSVETMRQTGLLGRVLPEVEATTGVSQEGPHHDTDVYGHTLRVADALPQDTPTHIKLAALYHDTGKPETREVSTDAAGNPRATFYGHEDISAQKVRTAMIRLRYDGDTVEATAHLCREHMRPMSLYNASNANVGEGQGGYSEKAVRRFVRRSYLARGEKKLADVRDVLTLNRADILGHEATHHGEMLSRWENLSEKVATLGNAPPESRPETARSPLDGKELMDTFGGRPGKWVGEVKAFLTEKVVEGSLSPGDKSGARANAGQFLASRDAE